jgi:hypothetical protein
MTSFLDSIRNALNAVVNSFSSGPPVLLTPEAVFLENLNTKFQLLVSDADCANNCAQSVISVLKPEDFELSSTSQTMIRAYLDKFDDTVGDIEFTVEEQFECTDNFKKALSEKLQAGWINRMAESFYRIFENSDENERANAAKSWTHKFFEGVQFLYACELRPKKVMSEEYVGKLMTKTSGAYREYAPTETQRKIETKRREHEKLASSGGAQGLEGCDVLKLWPGIEDAIAYLQECVRQGHYLQSMGWSIPDSEYSQTAFKDVFKKKSE